ncbi:Na+/H+ antiporter subunit E [Roseimicrobium sp. ORNL1]|uniref:Na+/H+ antiporter subunit E n=1 Tax=Roseimicrobium sp. ORNL1 TaxID=2711231 RepID=UPI0013E0FFA1|nr:Na+/H+ antiporter subunit E [Roseimicrobium sp. ORNL1]QIF01814.1 hypothetical protein G5S37_09835 [Roseimicrobium sp. ORNL1]
MKALLMHFLVASVWTFLHGTTTLGGFVLGGIASFFLLWVFQKVLHCEDYVRRVRAALAFFVRFLVDVVRSNLAMAKLCLDPKVGSKEGSFTTYDVSDLSETETVLMAYLINLTPGTTVADRTDEGLFVLHSFPSMESAELAERIHLTLRKPLLEITR